MQKTLLIFAGPNGSGKSTVVDEVARLGKLPLIFVGPDEVVKWEDFRDIEDDKERYISAMEYCEALRMFTIQSGESLGFETVFSTEEKLEFMRRAKSYGYTIEVIFVTTEDPNVNISRVAKRVESGGHNVPTEKIISRYNSSMGYLPQIYELADNLYLYDNSSDRPFLVLCKMDSKVILLNEELRKPWVNTWLVSKLEVAVSSSLPTELTSTFIRLIKDYKVGLMEFSES